MVFLFVSVLLTGCEGSGDFNTSTVWFLPGGLNYLLLVVAL